MGKKDKVIKQKYWFWRWIILSVIRFQKLYFLVWGILILGAIVCFKTEIISLLKEVIQ